MFGYIKTDFPYLYMKDVTLYKAMYCGLCKSIGKVCGQKARLVLNYDLTFLSVLAHNIKNVDVKVEKSHCVIHPITKRPIAKDDDLTQRIASLNVILSRYKLNDDVCDEGKGRFVRAMLSKAYKKAKKREPKFDEIVKTCYKDLVDYEKSNGDSIDMVADPFGCMMQMVMKELLDKHYTEECGQLAYQLGKWIYLIDALDDFDKDKRKKSYNVFCNAYSDSKTKQELIKNHSNELITIFSTILGDIDSLANKIDYKFNHDLTDNVLRRGLKVQTKNILENNKCKSTTKF